MHLPEYTISLAFWIVPIIWMQGFFSKRKLLKPPQKKAIWINIGVLALIGFILDLIFGKLFFVFPNPNMTLGINIYGIPLEEFIFYISGFWFILFAYVYSDEYFLLKYNMDDSLYRQQAFSLGRTIEHRLNFTHIFFPTGLMLSFVVLKHWLNPTGSFLPGYILFLTVVAYVPFFFFWKITRHFINFRAFFLTLTVTTLISIIWEVTLALPRGYWNYNPIHMLGIFIPPWSHLPIEAVTVWIFSMMIVLSYEFTKVIAFRAK